MAEGGVNAHVNLFGEPAPAKRAKWRCLQTPGTYPAARIPVPVIPPPKNGARKIVVVDSFAGGGGASNGVEEALRRLEAANLLPVGHPLAIDDPMLAVPTKARSGLTHVDAAVPPLTEAQWARARQVAEFLRRHGCWDGGEVVTLVIRGVTYVIVDIGMRMLTPRELARAQHFPDSYILAPIYKGKPLSETEQRHKIGNSVCEGPAAAFVEANYRPPLGWGEQTVPFMEAAE